MVFAARFFASTFFDVMAFETRVTPTQAGLPFFRLVPHVLLLMTLALVSRAVGASSSASGPLTSEPLTIVSLDYCADQYALKLAPANARLILSTNATESFSYLKSQAQAYPQQVARLEHIVRAKPDFVVRSYGGGALIASRLNSLNIPVIQLQFSQNFDAVYANILVVSKAFGRLSQGKALIKQTQTQLASIQSQLKQDLTAQPSLLYLTASGATAGQQTLINRLIVWAGFNNYVQRDGWPSLSLEHLSLKQPQHLATAFFDRKEYLHFWSAAHHPVAKRLLTSTPVTELNSATLSCVAWYTVDSVKKLSDARRGNE